MSVIQQILAAGTVESDQYWEYVKSLLHFNGADDTTTIEDRIAGHSWSVLGDAKIRTNIYKFGGASLALDGTDAAEATSSDFVLGVSDFTIEMFVRPSSIPSAWLIFDQRPNGADAEVPTIYATDTTLRFFSNGADRIGGGSIQVGVWQHIALCRASGNYKLFLGGAPVGSAYSDSMNYTGNRIRIGLSGYDGIRGTVGNIDEFRLTRGISRYSSAFDPPTKEFPSYT